MAGGVTTGAVYIYAYMDFMEAFDKVPHERLIRIICPYDIWHTWWRHQMETFSELLAICAGNSPVPREFPAQRLVTRSFDVFFDLCLNKRLSKQSWGWWFETLSCSLWRHCNDAFHPRYQSLGRICNPYIHCLLLQFFFRYTAWASSLWRAHRQNDNKSHFSRWHWWTGGAVYNWELFLEIKIKLSHLASDSRSCSTCQVNNNTTFSRSHQVRPNSKSLAHSGPNQMATILHFQVHVLERKFWNLITYAYFFTDTFFQYTIWFKS